MTDDGNVATVESLVFSSTPSPSTQCCSMQCRQKNRLDEIFQYFNISVLPIILTCPCCQRCNSDVDESDIWDIFRIVLLLSKVRCKIRVATLFTIFLTFCAGDDIFIQTPLRSLPVMTMIPVIVLLSIISDLCHPRPPPGPGSGPQNTNFPLFSPLKWNTLLSTRHSTVYVQLRENI